MDRIYGKEGPEARLNLGLLLECVQRECYNFEVSYCHKSLELLLGVREMGKN